MTADDLTELESRFNVRLPLEYREFLLSYPPDLAAARWQFGRNPVTEESPADREARNTLAGLVELNDCVREPGVSWMGDDGPWPRNYFVIGDDQCGDYWCIDAASGESAVYFYDHELGDFERKHNSVAGFKAQLLVDIAEWNR